MYRVSSKGNPWHDKFGRFCHGPKGEIDTWGNPINDEQRKEAVKYSCKNKKEYQKQTERRLKNDNKRKNDLSKRKVQEQQRSNASDERRTNNRKGIRRTGNGISNVLQPYTNGNRFHEKVEIARHTHQWGCCVDNHDPKELDKMKMFLSDNGKAGIAVEEDGNICCAFNTDENISVKELLDIAKNNGGTKMDCYGKTLTNMYEYNGFKVVARIPYNADYVDKTDFNKPLLQTKPDVYVLMLRPKNEQMHISSQSELDNLPTFDNGDNAYDEALSYRDSLIKRGL